MTTTGGVQQVDLVPAFSITSQLPALVNSPDHDQEPDAEGPDDEPELRRLRDHELVGPSGNLDEPRRLHASGRILQRERDDDGHGARQCRNLLPARAVQLHGPARRRPVALADSDPVRDDDVPAESGARRLQEQLDALHLAGVVSRKLRADDRARRTTSRTARTWAACRTRARRTGSRATRTSRPTATSRSATRRARVRFRSRRRRAPRAAISRSRCRPRAERSTRFRSPRAPARLRRLLRRLPGHRCR